MAPADCLSYHEHVSRLARQGDRSEALRQAVGGNFDAVGKLEHALLRSLGLQDGQMVVDVGCGSGRLAAQLAMYPCLRYIGCDVEPRLIKYAQEVCRRPDWTFLCTDGTAIPSADARADVVCFFSVFTHLPHEHTYRYIHDAFRALKPSGWLVFSFLEFRIPSHWSVFETGLGEGGRAGQHLNQFISRDAIDAWARHTGFSMAAIHDGDQPHITLSEDVVWDDGRCMRDLGHLGQSVAILRKPG